MHHELSEERGPKILFVHGMRMQRAVREELAARWAASLRASVEKTEWGRANPQSIPQESDVALVYWADFFNAPPVGGAAPAPPPAKGFDLDELRAAYYGLLRGGVLGLDLIVTHSAIGRPTDAAAVWIDRLIHQTAVYMHNGPVYRADPSAGDGAFFQVQGRFARGLTHGTRLVIGHSLGSVVAYEGLCRTPHRVHTLLTVGSPIATPNLIFEPLKRRMSQLYRHPIDRPPPWPGVRQWINVFAKADVWCVPVPRLAPIFAAPIRDIAVEHGSVAAPSETHALTAYLEHLQVGEIIGEALRAIEAEDAPRPTA